MFTIKTNNLYLFTVFFGLCIFSSFLLQKIYVVQYLLFTGVVFLYFGKIEFLKINTNAVLFLLLFLLWSSLIYFLNIEYSQVKQLAKLFVVALFFFGAITLINNLQANQYLENFIRIVYYFIAFILILNFLHIVRNVMAENLWTLPVSDALSSTAAYRIEKPGIYFGASNKNIWATKILLAWIIFHQYQKRLSASGGFPWAIHFIVLFSVVYTFSRTAQVVFLAYLCFNFLVYIKHRRKLAKVILIFILLPAFAYGVARVVSKFIHFDFGPGDGFYSRIMLWTSVLEINFQDLILGSGIQYGAYFIPRYTTIDNDNFHNVFLNQMVDVGLIGLLCYVLFLFFYFRARRGILSIRSLMLFMPLFLVANSHYLGYDNDIFNYLVLSYPLLYFEREEKGVAQQREGKRNKE